VGQIPGSFSGISLTSRTREAASLLTYFTRAEEKLRAADMPNWDADGYKKLQEQIEKLKK
jgi:hypothetical protein